MATDVSFHGVCYALLLSDQQKCYNHIETDANIGEPLSALRQQDTIISLTFDEEKFTVVYNQIF